MRHSFLIGILLATVPGAALAQWGADPAQAGAIAYCNSRNQGQSISQAEVAAMQAMVEILQLTSGPVLAGVQIGFPALEARWRYLAASLCPEVTGLDAADDVDKGIDDPRELEELP